MSRIIVKNLPKKITVQKLEEIFSEKGQVTDVQPKYTKTGRFRQFAFIGYKTELEAQAAKSYFHNTFIQTSRVKVDLCCTLGDSTVKAWSKHTKKTKEEQKEQKPEKQIVNHKEKNANLNNDSEFAAFMQASADMNSKQSWRDNSARCQDDETGICSEDGSTNDETDKDSDHNDTTMKKPMSDMEYIRSKMTVSSQKEIKVKKPHVKYTVKVKKLPFSCKKKHLKAFFHPLKPISIRIPPRIKGFAYVGFSNEKDLKRALNKHRGFLEGHMVDVACYAQKAVEHTSGENVEKKVPEGDPVELIAETGRIFVRNLSFSVTEENLKQHFSKYGPIAEISLPIDFYTKQILGYALVTYVFAEHAVKAYSELDGTVFQGRMLHVLPGQPKKELVCDPKGMTFKEKKVAKQKSQAHSSHNWNTLFLGQNAVVDVMAKEYNLPKANILSSETRESAAVRMALGETQLVVETRKFLLEHGVKLDAFSQAAAERSKSVIIAKNLPSETTSNELCNLFSKFGAVVRVILPPSAITALIEFQEPAEAKVAFNKLVYKRIRYKPLYLEWAPMDVFSMAPTKENVDESEENLTSQVSDEKGVSEEAEVLKDDGDDDAEKEEVPDIPPEGTTLFVKNLNFDTTEKSLEKHFKVCGPLHSVVISKKKDVKSGNLLSMGFGFIQYKNKSSAQTAMQDLQLTELDGHALELKYSNRATVLTVNSRKKKPLKVKESAKICVRNVPFECTKKEIQDMFEQFGELKYVRLPRQTGTGCHRGFGFVEYAHKECAKRAFEVLCHSTHLLGRRLVLEWALPDDDVDTLRMKTVRDSQQGAPERRVKKAKLMEDALLAKPADQ